MHTWWRGNWEGADPITPTGTHQRQVQKRRQRRRVQETCIVESQPTDHSATQQSADSDTTRLEQEPRTSTAAKGTPRRKRNKQEMEAEEQADRAATEIVDLVDQEVQRSAGTPTGASLSPGMHISAHSIATDTTERLAYTAPAEEAAIPE